MGGLDYIFFSVTNIEPSIPKPQSVIFLVGSGEHKVPLEAFKTCSPGPYKGNTKLLDVGALMSRKHDFIPAIKAVLERSSNDSSNVQQGRGRGGGTTDGRWV